MIRRLHDILRNIWDEETGGTMVSLRLLLCLPEFPYRLSVGGRNLLYDRGLVKQKRLPCPVVSVGNITTGGTGKTPLVILLSRLLRQDGYRPAVLSRGYGGREDRLTVVTDGRTLRTGLDKVGDEARLIAQRTEGIPVITGACRFDAGLLAIRSFGVNVIVLDDGFQHRALHRDCDIVLLDRHRPFGNGHLLPAGCLREPTSSLRRADVLIIQGGRSADTAQLPRFSEWSNSRPLLRSCHRPTALWAADRRVSYPLDYLRGKKVYGFAGIGNPGSFRRTLELLEGVTVGFSAFPDHYVYEAPDVKEIRERARQSKAEMIVTTEKDFVRLDEYADLRAEIFVLSIETALAEGDRVLVDLVRDRINKSQIFGG